MSQFSDDFPFDKIVEDPCLVDPGVRVLSAWVGRYPSEAPADAAGFDLFCDLVEGVTASWKADVLGFIENMRIGAYATEFGQFANRTEKGSFPGCLRECSQASECISLFCQALHYNDEPAIVEQIQEIRIRV